MPNAPTPGGIQAPSRRWPARALVYLRDNATSAALLAFYVALTAVIAWAGCEQRRIARWQAARDSRMMFDNALVEAERTLCPACASGHCAPPAEVDSSGKLSLDTAAKLEKEVADDLTASEYLTLARLGDSCWDFKQVSRYCENALARSSSDLDRHSSYLVLGHLHFRHYKDDEGATIFAARENFKLATTSFDGRTETLRTRYFVAMAYAYWAADEAFYGDVNVVDAILGKSYQGLYTVNYPASSELVREVGARVGDAKKGKPPELPCPSQLAMLPHAIYVRLLSEGAAASGPVPFATPTPAPESAVATAVAPAVVPGQAPAPAPTPTRASSALTDVELDVGTNAIWLGDGRASRPLGDAEVSWSGTTDIIFQPSAPTPAPASAAPTAVALSPVPSPAPTPAPTTTRASFVLTDVDLGVGSNAIYLGKAIHSRLLGYAEIYWPGRTDIIFKPSASTPRGRHPALPTTSGADAPTPAPASAAPTTAPDLAGVQADIAGLKAGQLEQWAKLSRIQATLNDLKSGRK